MSTKLARWGNSLGLRIGRDLAECAAWKAGDILCLRLLDSGEVIVRAAKPRGVPEGYKVPDKEAVRQPTDEEVLAQW